nr:hypothetical protein Iba_chr06bCG10010 [Ipomoea batatas]
MLARSITGRMGSPTVVNHLDLLCLYNMVKGVKIHMEIVMARMLQAHASFKTSTIFIGPFLSCLLRSLGLGPQLDAEWVLAMIESLNWRRFELIGFSRVHDSLEEDDQPPTPPP